MADATETAPAAERLDAAQLDQDSLIKELGLAKPEEVKPLEIDPALEQKAEAVVVRLLAGEPADPEAQEAGKTVVEGLGLQVQRDAALNSEKLKAPIHRMSQRTEEGGEVAKSLVDLRVQIEALDPTRFNFEPGWTTRLLGYLPGFGTPLKRYFSRYESAQTILNAIIQSLEGGREQLKRDNITLGADQQRLRESCVKLTRTIQFAQLIDAKLQAKLDNEIPPAGEQHRFVTEELLFPLRQRIVDLQQQLAVSQQGILAMEVVIRNNKELVRGVNRALSVTVNALQVAVTVALALADQRIVLENVQALSSTTSNLIAETAARLKSEGAAIHKEAAATQLDIEALKKTFADIRSAMEDIAQYRREALPQMSRSIREMDALVSQAAEAIAEKEKTDRAQPVMPLEIE